MEKVPENSGRTENIYTLPNLLSVSRIFISFYLRMMISQGEFSTALIGLGIAGITDLLDGWIARKWKSQASSLGSFLDPMADRILIGGLYLTLSSINLIPVALAYLILTHNTLQLMKGAIVRYISLPTPRTLQKFLDPALVTAQLFPTFLGKFNFGVQLSLIIMTLLAAIYRFADHSFLHFLWYFTAFTTISAELSYIVQRNTYKILTQPTQKDKESE